MKNKNTESTLSLDDLPAPSLEDLPAPSSDSLSLEDLPAPRLEDLPAPSDDYSTLQQVKDLARATAQGASFGFSDEALAMVRAIKEKRKYEDVVKEEREALERISKESPVLATGAELIGGIGPALLTGGGSAVAQAGRAGIMAAAKAAAKEGAKFGAATALGKTEQLFEKPVEAAKEVAMGAVTGGALGGLITGGTQALGKALPAVGEKFAKEFPRAKTAFEYAKRTGKEVGSIEPAVSKELETTALGLTESLRQSQKMGSKRIGEYIDRLSDKGVKITSNDLSKSQAVKSVRELATAIDDVLPRIPSDKRGQIQSFLDKMTPSGESLLQIEQQFSPSEIYSIRKTLSQTYHNLIKNDPNISFATKSKMLQAEEALRKALEDKLPAYKALNDVQSELYSSFESVINKGEKPSIKYTRDAVGNEEQTALLSKALEASIGKSELKTIGGDPHRVGLDQFKTKLVDVFKKDMDLIEKGVIKPEQSMFAVVDDTGKMIGKKTPEEIFDTIKQAGELQSARYGAIGSREVTGEQLKGALDIVDRTLSERGMIKAASYLGKRAFNKPEPSKVSPVLETARSLFDASPKTIGQVSAMLLNDPETKRYGESLRQAEIENNQQKKNATLFAAMQNPKSREMILNSQKAPERKPAGEIDKDYIAKRNRFIEEMESGPGASEQKEFDVYKDSKGLRTIGHGYNIDAPGQFDKMKKILGLSDEEADAIVSGEMSISKEQADKLFNFSAKKAERQLDEKLQSIGGVQLTSDQRAALVSMIYNSPKLIGPKILEALKSGNYEEVARLISITSDFQKRKHPGLPIRRRKEAALFSGSEEE
jgi:GH24 family phage-related lysozyme (muramidase)